MFQPQRTSWMLACRSSSSLSWRPWYDRRDFENDLFHFNQKCSGIEASTYKITYACTHTLWCTLLLNGRSSLSGSSHLGIKLVPGDWNSFWSSVRIKVLTSCCSSYVTAICALQTLHKLLAEYSCQVWILSVTFLKSVKEWRTMLAGKKGKTEEVIVPLHQCFPVGIFCAFLSQKLWTKVTGTNSHLNSSPTRISANVDDWTKAGEPHKRFVHAQLDVVVPLSSDFNRNGLSDVVNQFRAALKENFSTEATQMQTLGKFKAGWEKSVVQPVSWICFFCGKANCMKKNFLLLAKYPDFPKTGWQPWQALGGSHPWCQQCNRKPILKAWH